MHLYDQTVATETHLKTPATCTAKAVYYKSCTCGEVSTTETFESGELAAHTLTHHEAISATCEGEGNIEYWTCSECSKLFSDAEGNTETTAETVKLPATGHSFSSDWSYDADNHWHAATCEHTSEKKDEAAHSGGTATCTAKAVCETCGQAYGELNAENHTGTAEWIKTATKHSKAYTCCGAVVVAEADHTWVNGVCSDCGYGCQHTGGTATCTEKALCETCGHEYGELNAENHTDTAEWIKTATKHSKAYTCCGAVIVAEADHTWNNGEVTTQPTYSSTGVKTYTCTVCEATKNETIPALVMPYVPPTTDTTTTTNPDGSTITTVTDKTTGTVTETTKTQNGTTGTVVTDKNGVVTEIKASVSDKAVTEAAANGAPVTLPVTVAAEEAAPAVSIEVPADVSPENTVKVEIPVENMTAGTVAVIVNEDGTEEVIVDSKMGANGVVVELNGNAALKIVDNSKEFEDLKNSQSWVTEAVAYTSARELFNGTSDTTFSPEKDTTRGMVVAVLYRMASKPETGAENIFNDVSDKAYYADAVKWAAENEIVKGYGDSFGATDTITREQLAVMLYNYAQYIGADTSARADLEADFTDGGSTHSWAKDALSWANAMGLLKGFGNGEIAPTGSATRAQVAAVIYRFCEQIAK